MSQRAPLFLVVLLAIAAALFLVLQPSDDGSSLRPSSNPELPEEDAPGAAELDEVTSASEVDGENLPASEGDRDEVRTGHRIQVIDLDGSPAIGVQVATWQVDGEQIGGLRRSLESRPHAARFFGEGQEQCPTTNDQGEIQLSTFGSCMVTVAEYGKTGGILIEAREDTELDAVHTLQLRESPMREVRVLEANGEPSKLRYSLTTQIALAEEAANFTGEIDDWDFYQVWQWSSNRIGQIADGRKMFHTGVAPEDYERLSRDTGKVLFRLALSGNGITSQAREVSPDEAGPIDFHLSAFGSVAIHLTQAPQGLVPTLVDSSGESRGDRGAQPSEVSGEWFEYERVPVGREFTVGALIRSSPKSGASPTRLDLGELQGPSSPGERVEKTIEYQHPPGFYGKFVFPEGVDPEAEFGDINRGLGRARFVMDQERSRTTAAQLEVFPDGSFSMSTASLDLARFPIDAIIGFQFVYRAEPKRDNQAPTAVDFPVYWASVNAQLPSADALVDLGEIELYPGEQLLEVVVHGPDGEPLPKAEVQLHWKRRQESENSDPNAYSSGGSRERQTDSEGRVVYFHRDWLSEFESDRRYERDDPRAQVDYLMVEVSHPDAETQQLMIPPGQAKLDVHLSRSGLIAGSVLPMHGVNRVRVNVFPVGESGHQARIASGYAQFFRPENGEETEFEIKSAPVGIWDVEFSVSGLNNESVLRVPSVTVVAGETTRDPRLQAVDLSQHIDMIRLQFRGQDGQPVHSNTVPKFSPVVVRFYSDGSGVGTTPSWNDGEIMLPIARGDSAELRIQAEGWIVDQPGTVKGGVHTVSVAQAPVVTFLVDGWSRLPPGARVQMRVTSASNRIGISSSIELDGPEVSAPLSAWGDIRIWWNVVHGSRTTAVTSTDLELTREQAVDGARFTVSIPEEVFEKLEEE